MNEAKLSDAQWSVLQPLLPSQPRTGRRREHDREVLNSLVYRLVTGARYRDLPRTPEYAPRTTTYHWLKQWTETGILDRLWQTLLSLLEQDGKLDLSQGSLDGSFVPVKRGAKRSTAGEKAKAQP